MYHFVSQGTLDISRLVLATVTSTSGSTPQKAGSSALFDSSGLLAGTIGGGVLENRVREIALRSIVHKRSGYYIFRLDSRVEGGEDSLCGGDIEVLIDAEPDTHHSLFEEIRSSMSEGTGGVIVTTIIKTDENDVKIHKQWISECNTPGSEYQISEALLNEVRSIINKRDPYFCKLIGSSPGPGELTSSVFLEPVFPRQKLIIAGAGHIGKALSHLGQLLDFEVSVIDDRESFANRNNIPDADHIFVDDPGRAISGIRKTKDTFIVIVTRGHKDDAVALRPCIGSEAGYIGMIGSRSKIAAMHKDFIEKGWATEKQWAEIRAPVGLDIGSRTVEEIAVSIAAQLIEVRNKRPGNGQR